MAGGCLGVSVALGGAVVVMQIHPRGTGTDHSPPHTPVLVPVTWSQKPARAKLHELVSGNTE